MSYVFNPYVFGADKVTELTTETINQLDDRYINVGEDVFNETIDNLNVQNLNMSSTGKIYFANDNTEQTTAYDPTVTNAQILNFANTDNTFTGENKFNNFNVIDALGNKTQIYHDGTNTYIVNTKNNGIIYFKTYDSNGLSKSVTIDMFANLGGVNDVFCNKVKSSTSMTIGTTSNLYNDSNGNFVIGNTSPAKEIRFQPTALSGGSWLMAYNPNGQLYGMNNVICHSLETKSIKFRDPTTFNLTTSQIYLSSGKEMIFDNTIAGSNTIFKFKTSDTSGTSRTLSIDQFINMAGVNDITMSGKLKMGSNISHFMSSSQDYIIKNAVSSGTINLQVNDSGGTMRQMRIDQFVNVSGINDFFCNRLYVNNTVFNPVDFNNLNTKCQMIGYYNDPMQTRIIKPSTGKGIYFCPDVSAVNYNPIVQSKDSVILLANSLPDSEGALTLTNWSQSKSGLRIKSNETEAYNLKILDGGLKFADDTIQTTAMTNSYLTQYIQTIVNQMSLVPQIPVGAIMPYTGNLMEYLPPGYLRCWGETVNVSEYQNLYNVIGQKFSNGQIIHLNSFYLPDFRGLFLKGTGTSPNIINQTPIDLGLVGKIQQQNVGHHAHTYKDRGSGSYTIVAQNPSPGTSTKIANDTDGMYWTDGNSYHSATHDILDAESRPNCIGIDYIIKY
jgi:microcystin-dependent protein